MKKIFLLFILSYALNAQWIKFGNVERLSNFQTGISNYAFSKDLKSIYTLDKKNVIIKWDYQTGDSVWSKKIKRDSLFTKDNWLHLSSDGASYCKSYFNVSRLSDNNILIFDINTNEQIDSIYDSFISSFQYITHLDFGIDYCDYITELNMIIFAFNYQVQQFFSEFTNSGYIGIKLKKGSTWENLNTFNSSIYSKYLSSQNFYFEYSDNYHGSPPAPPGQNLYSSSTNKGNIIVNFKDNKTYNLAEYNQSEDNKGKVSVHGNYYLFSSVFFTNDNQRLVATAHNNIYYKNINDTNSLSTSTLTDIGYNSNLKIFPSMESNFFYIIDSNSIKIYDLKNFNYHYTFQFDSLKYISNLKNSSDSNFLFILDNFGNLYRVKTDSLLRLIALEIEDNFNKPYFISIFPNPSSDIISIETNLDNFKLNIFNSLGINVLNEENQKNIDVSSLAPGIYFCNIISGNYSETQKFVVIR